MRSFLIRLSAVVGLFIASMVGLLAPAQASVDCINVVNDQAGVIKNFEQVERAAVEAERSVGADVKVVTVKSFSPSASLDDYYRATIAACKAWQGNSADGTPVPKSNLLAVFMSMDERKLGIFYGDDWIPALRDTGAATRIQSEEMGPFFRGGDFAGGFARGIESSQQAISDFQHPAPAAPAAPVTNIDNSEPTDFTGLWIVLGSLVGLGGIGTLGFLGYNAHRARQAKEERRRAARQRALANRDSASTILNAIGDEARKAVRTAKVTKYSAAGPEVSRELNELYRESGINYEAATSGMADASAAFGTITDNLTEAEYEQMEHRYAQVLKRAQAARDADGRIDSICAEVDNDLEQLVGDQQVLAQRLRTYIESVQALRSQGYRLEHGDVSRVQQILQDTALKGASLAAIQDTKDASELLEDLERTFGSFSQLLRQQADAREELRGRLADARPSVAEAAESFTRISQKYARTSWESVQGNGSEATRRLEEAVQELEVADKAADMNEQRWNDVLTSTQQGNLLVDEAIALLSSIIDREANLIKAEASAQQELDLAQADIDKAAKYEQTYDADIRDSLEGDLAEARDLLEKGRLELTKPQPDYLVALDAILAANHKADRIYEECVEEHEAAERLRNQAAAAVDRAGITINKTAQFISNHSSDVGNSAPRTLSEAKESLQKAKRASDASKKLGLAQEALDQAQRAYKKAKSDFDDAEAAREAARAAERRRREEREAEERRDRERRNSYTNNTVIVGGWGSSSSSSSSSSFDSFGGGSSSSFGGFDGGGGGSSSGW